MIIESWRDQLTLVLEEKKAIHIQSFKVDSLFADYFVVASALSSRQLWALCQAVEKECKSMRIKPIVQGKQDETRWIVIDACGVFVHLFLAEGRAYYELEQVWKEEDLGVRVDT
jgi:ribosome silencing factor RsfS/YbeB/iojap